MNSKSQLACWGGGGVLGPQPVSCLSLFKKKKDKEETVVL